MERAPRRGDPPGLGKGVKRAVRARQQSGRHPFVVLTQITVGWPGLWSRTAWVQTPPLPRTVCLWASFVTSLCLGVPICKMGIRSMYLTHKCAARGPLVNLSKAFGTAPVLPQGSSVGCWHTQRGSGKDSVRSCHSASTAGWQAPC